MRRLGQGLQLDFFEAPPPEADSSAEHSPPPWVEPPRDVLAALVPDRRVLARSQAVAVVLSHIDVYRTGCELRLRVVAVRPPDMSDEATAVAVAAVTGTWR